MKARFVNEIRRSQDARGAIDVGASHINRGHALLRGACTPRELSELPTLDVELRNIVGMHTPSKSVHPRDVDAEFDKLHNIIVNHNGLPLSDYLTVYEPFPIGSENDPSSPYSVLFRAIYGSDGPQWQSFVHPVLGRMSGGRGVNRSPEIKLSFSKDLNTFVFIMRRTPIEFYTVFAVAS